MVAIAQKTHEKLSLACWFEMQDDAARHNAQEISAEYNWLDQSLQLLSEMHVFTNCDEAVAAIRTEVLDSANEQAIASTVVINLTTDALGGLINGCRLLTFGATPDSLVLVRSAFEACALAEFIALDPQSAQRYLEIEQLVRENPSLNIGTALHKKGLSIGTVLASLTEHDGENRQDFYARLCNYGAHALPTRVALRLSVRDGAVLGPVSQSTPNVSRRNWLLNVAYSLMAVAKYAIELLLEFFTPWFERSDFPTRWKPLLSEYQEMTAK